MQLIQFCELRKSYYIFALLSSLLISHYIDAIMSTIASQITSLTIVYSTVYAGANQRKHQSSASLAFVRGIHRGSVNSPHKGPVTRKMFPFDNVIMTFTNTAPLRMQILLHQFRHFDAHKLYWTRSSCFSHCLSRRKKWWLIGKWTFRKQILWNSVKRQQKSLKSMC